MVDASTNLSPASSPSSHATNQPVPNKAAKTGDAITPIIETTKTIAPNVPLTFATNSLSCFLSSFSCTSVNTGINACANAPSANRRRRKLGILLAKKNTSAAAPSPISLATTTSRTRPNTRETRVIILTIRPDFINFRDTSHFQ